MVAKPQSRNPDPMTVEKNSFPCVQANDMGIFSHLILVLCLKMASCLPLILMVLSSNTVAGQTEIPNGDFEVWQNHGRYQDPQFWDSDNKTANAVPFIGKTVVSKDSDHASGTYSAKLETKSIPFVPFDVPGILTLGTLSLNIQNGTYSLTGGVPIHDIPTHLRGFYKFMPQGNDSCIIAIGLSRSVKGVRDSLALGYFSAKNAAPGWTPFSALIEYDTAAAPDSFNILIIASAVASPTAGTTLWVDQLSLGYSTGMDSKDPAAGIDIFQDRDNREIGLFFDFPAPQNTFIRIYNMTGQQVAGSPPAMIRKRSVSFDYSGFPDGYYILVIVHNTMRFTRKFIVD